MTTKDQTKTQKTPVKRLRGCGVRVQRGLYLSWGTDLRDDGGKFDLAQFLVDAPIPFKQDGSPRAPQLIEDRQGVLHVVMSVGADFYPFLADFIEEAIQLGVSKRVPLSWDFTGLTPGKSKLLLTHPRAIPNFDFDADFGCVKKGVRGVDKSKVHKDGDPECLGALWPLAAYHVGAKHEAGLGQDGEVVITTPSVTYPVPKPKSPLSQGEDPLAVPPEVYSKGAWGRGIFLALPQFYLEWVDQTHKVPKVLASKAEKTGVVLKVVPE